MEIHLDFFPAVVVLPDGGRLERVRVVVADGRAVAFGSENGIPVVAANVEAPDPHVVLTGLPYRVQTVGGEWTITRDQGCGCGHILKAIPREHLLGLAGVT